MTENQKKLLNILSDMFQFDQADLDFGVYRIMAMKRKEVQNFLEEELPAQITQGLEQLSQAKEKNSVANLDKKISELKNIGISGAVIAELEEKKTLFAGKTDIASLESDVYSHLTNFFSRYYDDGDFISQRRYKDGVYAIPYEGEEVKLHWANADQYYIKTTEYFKDYVFKNSYGDTVHLKLVEADTEKDNNKSNEKRFFQLSQEKPFEVVEGILFIYMEYKNGGRKDQKECTSEIIQLFSAIVKDHPNFHDCLTETDGKTKLERHLNRYTAKNSFDYFIHKDLGKFLNRELDFYIKNDVIFLDDIDEQDEQKTKTYLTKAKVIRMIAKKIITFLAQIENFQKKLWLKKKFVVETNYCITLDRVPKSLYTEIAENTAQIAEWKRLFAIDEIEDSLVTLSFSVPLATDFLCQNPYLVLDTAFFSAEFKEKLIDSIDNLDDSLDGLLIHSENFQALNLLQERYREKVKSIAVDPPYNTEEDRQNGKFIYKDSFEHSSWISCLKNRTELSWRLLSEKGLIFSTIDDNELFNLKLIYDVVFGLNNFKANLIWNSRKSKQNDIDISLSHNYILTYSKNKSKHEFYGEPLIESEFSNPDNDQNGKWKSSPLDAPGVRERTSFYCITNPNTGEAYYPPKGRHWTIFEEDVEGLIKSNQLYFGTTGTSRPQWKRYWTEVCEDSKTIGTIWDEVDTATQATKELENIFGVKGFETPKPVTLMQKIIQQSARENEVVLDYFAGSGTTGHAVINLNRKDKGSRKYILVEMGEYFDTVTKPRIQKVIYSDTWKDGKPISRLGSSHAFKYLRLESYEDTLNNLRLEKPEENIPLGLASEEYMLSYMLDIESKNSNSLLNIDKLANPFDYEMNIIRNFENNLQNIDLVESFNYLIGLVVGRSYAKCTFDADFSENEYGLITAALKEGDTYKFKMIEGKTLSGDSVLVLWRELTGDVVKDNAALDAFFQSKRISTTDFEYNKIYVNGDNNLENKRADNEKWKVVLIEEEMKKRMFEGV